MGAFVCIRAQQCGSTSLLPRAWTTSFGHPSHMQSTSGMKSRTSSSSGLGRSLDESANRGREGPIHARQADPTVWLIFKSVLAWSSQAGAPVQMCIAAVSEAPHGNASAYPDKFDVRGAFRSQGGKVLFSTTEDLCEKQERSRAHHHIRQCRAEASCRWHNQEAEPFPLSDAVEAADVCYERASQMRTDTQYGRDLPRVT